MASPVLPFLISTSEPNLRKKIYGRSNPACRYHLDRVIAAEATREFAEAQESRSKRKTSGKRAIRARIARLMTAIGAMSVSVQVIKPAHLQPLAIDGYHEWHGERNDPASNHSDKAFLERICVNFIRHEFTEYEHSLCEVAGRTGEDHRGSRPPQDGFQRHIVGLSHGSRRL